MTPSSSSSTSPSSLDAHVVATKLDAIHHLLLTIVQRQEALQYGQAELFRLQHELRSGQVEVRTGQLELNVGQQMLLANEEKNREDILAEINDVFTDLVAEPEHEHEEGSEDDSDATLVAQSEDKAVSNPSCDGSCSHSHSHSLARSRSISPRQRRRGMTGWSAKVGDKVKAHCRDSLSKLSTGLSRPQQEEQVSLWSMPFSELGLELTTEEGVAARLSEDDEGEEETRHHVRMHILQVIREANLETDTDRIYGCH